MPVLFYWNCASPLYTADPEHAGKSWIFSSAGFGLRSWSLHRGWAWMWPLCPPLRQCRTYREACKDTGQCFRTFKAGRRNWHDCSPLLTLKRREADPENTELILGFQHVPSGELEWHLHHRFDVFIKLGKQPGLSEPFELERSTDVNNKNTRLWENTLTDGCCRIQPKTYWSIVATASWSAL